jgi:hypothetical protein
MATVTAVIDRAANDLGLLRLGQTLQAQDSARITSAYNEIYAQLKKEGIATWASTGTVPDEVVPFLATMMADNCLSTYALSLERYKRIKTDVQGAMRDIRKNTAPIYVSQDEPAGF